MNLQERLLFLQQKIEETKTDYENTQRFSTKLLLVSLLEECDQVSKKIEAKIVFDGFIREAIAFYSLYPQIKEIAAKFSKNNSPDQPHLINVIEAAKKCGIKNVEFVPEEKSGKHAVLEDDTIYVNQDVGIEKQRFAIAHEIGHKVLDKKRSSTMKKVARLGNTWKENAFLNTPSLSEDEKENLIWEEIVDYFAAVLLMPHDLFISFLSKNNNDIAKIFNVTERSVKKRREEIVHEK